jgi:outer membrane biosynthesis protein TonB
MNRYLYRFRVHLGVAALLCGSIYAHSHAVPTRAQDSAQSGAAPVQDSKAGALTEDELKQMLAGKTFYLRGGYLDNTLSFDEQGNLIGHSLQGSYTLCLIQIDKVHLSKHKVELEGIRYGLHFLGELPNEDPTKAVDRVRITPKKKLVRITIDRELVVSPKKKKEKKADKAVTAKQSASEPIEESAASVMAKAETAAAPESEHPADGKSVTTTTSPAHAKRVLQAALDAIFAPSLDERMIATLPDFWKLYYQAAATHADYSPADPGILRQNQVDQKAKLLSPVEPPSNEYAQAGGVAGMALYHAIIGPDGKPQEVVVGRPIGFGLDENAADSIRKASFQPAIKDGKPVAVLLDLVVQFRIYSKRTSQPTRPENSPVSTTTILPGPYSVNQP